MKTRLCNRCGNEYQYERSTSTYCSDNCRTLAWKVGENVIDKLYINYNESLYRVKVYENTIWVERQQPVSESQTSFDRVHDKVYEYDRKSWVISDVIDLLDEYEKRVHSWQIEDDEKVQREEKHNALPSGFEHIYEPEFWEQFDDDDDDDDMDRENW